MKNLNQLNKVGEKTEKALNKLGLETILDLVFYFPYRYERYEEQNLKNISINQNINIEAEIELIRNKRSLRKRMMITEALVKNEQGSIEIIWFNQPFIGKSLKIGDKISLAGKITSKQGRLMMISPVYEKIIENNKKIHTKNIVPVYSLSASISQKQIRYLIHQALEKISEIPDYLTPETISRQNLININEAIKKIHFPENFEELNRAIDRFKFSELFLFQVKSYLLKKDLEKKKSPALTIEIELIKKFINKLPYKLGLDQKRAIWSILKDTERNIPMSRLLQGDVGSGKTIVALIAIFNCLLNKKQSALMVPSEILAKQHYQSAVNLFSENNFKVGLITSKKQESNFPLNGSKKQKSQEIAENSQLIIGTHSLIQEKIKYKNLSLVIVDEQHRFGVSQRQEIVSKNIDDNINKTTPHFLSMTATPIPRSLALMSFYGLNFSIISEKPKDRKEIITKIIQEDQRDKMYKFIEQEIKKGFQAFIVCPLIDPSDKSGSKSVKDEYARLKKSHFSNIEIVMLHGKMKTEEKEDIMNKFLKNEIKILISTSVIELGIDIPNANIMLIEGAERFGLSQLHQFRGRVGRSDIQSYCFLSIGKEDLDQELFEQKNNSKSMERLRAMEKYNDGLSLAKIDLQNRGSGNFYGLEQSGIMNFRFATLFDYEIMKKVEEEIKEISKNDPELKKNPKLLQKIKSDLKNTHLE